MDNMDQTVLSIFSLDQNLLGECANIQLVGGTPSPSPQYRKPCITVWPIFSFEWSYSCTSFHQKLIFLFYSKKLYQGQFGLTHIFFSRILILYKCSLNAHIFLVLKNLSKNCIRDSMVWPFFSFSRILSSFH